MSGIDDLTRAPPQGDAPVPAEQRTWGMLCHVAAFSAFFTGLGAILGPLIVWLIKRDEMPFVNDQGREAVNFNLTLLLVAIVLILFSVLTFGIGAIPAIPVAALVGLFWLIVTIVAAVKANDGEYYRYPLSLRLIK